MSAMYVCESCRKLETKCECVKNSPNKRKPRGPLAKGQIIKNSLPEGETFTMESGSESAFGIGDNSF